MDAGSWSDRWTAPELAARIRGLHSEAASVLRGDSVPRSADVAHDLANDVNDAADAAARRGAYEDYAALADAADALRELAERAETGVTTGEFRALRSTVAGGASVTEYVGEDTARYMAVDLGRSDQPPELIRVWAADPDDVEDDDDGVPL